MGQTNFSGFCEGQFWTGGATTLGWKRPGKPQTVCWVAMRRVAECWNSRVLLVEGYFWAKTVSKLLLKLLLGKTLFKYEIIFKITTKISFKFQNTLVHLFSFIWTNFLKISTQRSRWTPSQKILTNYRSCITSALLNRANEPGPLLSGLFSRGTRDKPFSLQNKSSPNHHLPHPWDSGEIVNVFVNWILITTAMIRNNDND